ncbi:MAG: flavodoxin-dependent (E)-4-hydroxy-3-methylbut-2-enyl-diphosphate synthase [Chloroflexi bacterium]|nr:flavodoxin-dependent (E)-4-hydroxy-3-methylbut-2-enyl-diphosphate synthase [Chloroflexota bacterium]
MIGDVQVGGGAPVVVQSMTNTDTRDAEATLRQVYDLAVNGCEIVRVAVPDMDAAKAIPEIVDRSPVPIVADIHFDYRLALAALDGGVHALRLNPGNITDERKVQTVVARAKERSVPIRIGVNFGSLPKKPYRDLGPEPTIVDRMVDAALWEIDLLEKMDFDLIKISLKAFDVPTMVGAYRKIAPLIPYPLHLGVTEAGLPGPGSIRSAVGMGILLAEGIGDTIRVSLTGDPCLEIDACYQILGALNLRYRGVTMVSCPSCGRAEIDIIGLANQVNEHLRKLNKPLKVAVMGCVVNGPGESRDADIGIAGGKGRGVIYKHGEVFRTVDEKDLLPALLQEIERM